MKSYPTIPSGIEYGESITAFDKIDGSNIRAEWSPKKGFYKFGRRNGLLDDSNPQLVESKAIIERDWAEGLGAIFAVQKYKRAIAFFEFWGPGSFGGVHLDEPHKCTLIDVSPFQRGILPPKEFLDLFGDLDHAPVLYEGKVDSDFIASVHTNALEGMTFEGVVCKGSAVRRQADPLMFKLKSRAWIMRVIHKWAGNDATLRSLLEPEDFRRYKEGKLQAARAFAG